MHLERSRTCIVSSNAPRSLKRLYSKRKIGMNPVWDPSVLSTKSASGASGHKSAPRGSKSTTFGNGFFQPCSPLKLFPNPVGESLVPPIQRPIYHWDQAEVREEFGIGGWCVVSCTSIQVSKIRLRPYGYIISYEMVPLRAEFQTLHNILQVKSNQINQFKSTTSKESIPQSIC